MKKYLKLFLLFIILLIPFFSLAEVKKSVETNKEKVNSEFKGPGGEPFVKGPTSPPPSNEEILAMRGIKVEEKGIFQKIWEWFASLF